MFQAIITRAQDAMGDAVAHAAIRALLAVPFIIAGGFGIAGLYLRLAREYGAESASLMTAALFLVIGLVALAILSLRKRYEEPAADDETAAAETVASNSEASSFAPSFTPAEKDLLLAGLTSAAPIALPHLVRLLLRNLPLVAVIAAAIFVLTQASANDEAQSSAEPMPAPAE